MSIAFIGEFLSEVEGWLCNQDASTGNKEQGDSKRTKYIVLTSEYNSWERMQ
jgi:hypothetical protein